MTTDAVNTSQTLNAPQSPQGSPDAETNAGPPRAETDDPVPGSAHDVLSRQIDALSLRQALLDFEMANARVLDLTARLVESNARVMKLQRELDTVSVELGEQTDRVHSLDTARSDAEASALNLRSELATIRSSTSFRVARRVSRLAARILR